MCTRESETDRQYGTNGAGLSAEEFRELSSKDFHEGTERQRELAELQSALRNFAKHFGPNEVYQQARAIYLETAEGRAGIEQEAAPITQISSAPKAHTQVAVERQREWPASERPRNEFRKLDDARRALGG